MPNTPFDFFDDNEYEHGFCECFKDPISCLASYCCTCCAVGYTTGKMENKGMNIWSCLCWPIGAYRNRRNIQAKNGIKETEDGSMCAVGLCFCCAITQDMHEVRKDLEKEKKAAQPAAVEEPSTADKAKKTEEPKKEAVAAKK